MKVRPGNSLDKGSADTSQRLSQNAFRFLIGEKIYLKPRDQTDLNKGGSDYHEHTNVKIESVDLFLVHVLATRGAVR